MIIHDEEVTVTAYVRSQQLMEPIDSQLETLRQLDSTDQIDDLALHVWPEQITLSEQTPYSDALDAFERMEAWADEHSYPSSLLRMKWPVNSRGRMNSPLPSWL